MAKVSYSLGIVSDLEESMTLNMPMSWMEDMMFLKANNRCAPTGLAPKRKTKAIQLHYGTKEEDEWRTSQQRMEETVGGLLRKLGESNFESVAQKLDLRCRSASNTIEFLQNVVDELLEIVSHQEGSQAIMVQLVSHLRASQPSFGHPVGSPASDTQKTPQFGIWLHRLFQKHYIGVPTYETEWKKLIETYHEANDDAKCNWADAFEYALKHAIHPTWMRPLIKAILDDPSTPLPLSFKIEDYFEN